MKNVALIAHIDFGLHKTQDLVDFGLWGFESPLSHQQLTFIWPLRRPFLVCRLVCQLSSRDVENAPPFRTRLAACRTVAGGPPDDLGSPSPNSTGPSARQIVVVILCRIARPTWGSILCLGPANRNSKVVSERAPLRGEPTANLSISPRPEELSTREFRSWPLF